MSDDSKTPELFSRSAQDLPDPEGNPDNALFSGETKSHHSRPPAANSDSPSAKSGSQLSSIPAEMGRFHHIEVVKSGGFGIVCRAQDSQAGRVVALKFPRPEKIRDHSDLKMFVDEANRAMELDHPGIVKTYAVEETAGLLAIVQEFIDGSDLRAQQTTMTNHQVIATLVAKIAEALAYAHRRGVYHRDLKPGNILLDKQGNPYITDFGLAMHEREQLFLPTQRCGTPYYMPPEQVAGLTRRLDGRSDIWSLGVILYELLTKRRPFQGRNEQEIFDQIEHNDPRPLRQIDAAIHPELQRICLKCLERQQRDRYPTADDLADDLRHWIANPAPERPKSGPRFVPRGLRAFTAEDADFFLELIPGTRSRSGLPTSIKFWLNRITLPVAVDLLTPIGVIFGPSGSGKSSYVRAGLLPLLSAEVVPAMIDCTATDTEAKLLRVLIERLEKVPEGIGLVDLCSGISQGLWRPTGKNKILVVLDQFEQRLSRGDDFSTTDLVKALKFCDGRVLQTLLLCRDDFFTHLSRFTDCLGLDLREGDNAQAIDLFDRKHARQVLIKYGQAYGQLPERSEEISPAQDELLEAVVSELATADYVVCVRLSLFAEMFRDRPWTLAELRAVGGVAGIGEKFLENNFGPTSRDKRLRQLGDHAQKVLGALLPPRGTDIRGGSKSEDELLAVAGLEHSRPTFGSLLKCLEEQLKLITRVENERITSGAAVAGSPALPPVVFQLTHDSMIDSIRAWLERQSSHTRVGRAGQRLRELGLQVLPGQTPRYLPTHAEWISWQWLLRSKIKTKSEQAVWATARQRFIRDLGIGLSVLVLAGLSIGWWSARAAREQLARDVQAAVELVTDRPFVAPSSVLAVIDREPGLSVPQLRSIYDAHPKGSTPRVGAALGLAPHEKSVQKDLIDAIVASETAPDPLEIMLRRVAIPVEHGAETWGPIYQNPDEDLPRRFRAFVAEVSRGSRTDAWPRHAQTMVAALQTESPSTLNHWLKLLSPAKQDLLPHFQTLFTEEQPAASPAALAMGIAAFSESKSAAAEYFVSHLAEWKTLHFQAALTAIVSQGCREEFVVAAQKRLEAEKDPWTQAALSLAMARLDHPEALLRLFALPPDQPAAILAVNGAIPGRLEIHHLSKLYREQSLKTFEQTELRRAVLMAFCLQAHAVMDDSVKSWLEEVAQHHIVNDPDAGCFSAAELLMRQVSNTSTRMARGERRAKSDERGILGQIMIDRSGLAFSLLPRTPKDNELIAVCTTELTYAEMFDFFAQRRDVAARFGMIQLPQEVPAVAADSDLQMAFQHRTNLTHLAMVYEYCNYLSDCEGLETTQWSYPTAVNSGMVYQTMVDPVQIGFRLPMFDEWQSANRSSLSLLNLATPEGPVVLNYAWLFENTTTAGCEGGRKLPNSAGLFDMFGNIEEICHADSETAQGGAGFYLMGRTRRAEVARVDNEPSLVTGGAWNANNLHTSYSGFRIVRRVPELAPAQPDQ
jgi:serine/threonine protein kinase